MHIGNQIKMKMKEKKKSVVWLANELGYSRINIYKIFDKRSIDSNILLRISTILDFDFFSLYTEELEQKKQHCDQEV
ncbi:MAG: XRE family transcriptional regulator [Bacteroidaceae bacterium]|nr:XRE family transcriptional regulator [Bacteroidaceae bacterium]